MKEMQSLQLFTMFLCAIAGILVVGTGMIIYLLIRMERNTRLPQVHRPTHGLKAILNRR